MEESIGLMILLQFMLIALNAVFACAEIAVISMNDNKLARMVKENDKRAIRLVKLTSQPAKFLATIQVAITLSGFMGSAFAAQNFSVYLVNWLVNLGITIPVSTLNTIAVVVITLVLAYFTLVLGELVPKRIAMQYSEKLALGLSGLISTISKVFAPLVWLLTSSTNVILRLFRIDPNAEDDSISEEEIRMMVDVGSERGVIDSDEKRFIQNVFEFDDLTADDIATHRTEVNILWMDDGIDVWDKTIKETKHAYYPICNDTADDVLAILRAKEYFSIDNKTKESLINKATKLPYYVPESIKADVLFRDMKKSYNHFAIVIDEYGGMSGIVTMGDLIEELVGNLEEDDRAVTKLNDNSWFIKGNIELDDLYDKTNIKLPDEDYDTLSGLIFDTYGSIPLDGQRIEVIIDDIKIEALHIKGHQIIKSKLTKL